METIQLVNFWDSKERKDIQSPAELVWLNSRVGEVWMGYADDGRRLIRLRDEHALLDPYFRYSHKVRAEVRKHKDSLMQISDPEFDRKYPGYRREYERKLAYQEKQTWMNTDN